MSAAEIVREWIGLKPDLDSKIPRAEVVEIEACVAAQLEALVPGCRYTVTGGYRRGKPESNDVDIVFCPPRAEVDVGRLLRDLVTRMTDLGERFARWCGSALTPCQGSSHTSYVSHSTTCAAPTLTPHQTSPSPHITSRTTPTLTASTRRSSSSACPQRSFRTERSAVASRAASISFSRRKTSMRSRCSDGPAA